MRISRLILNNFRNHKDLKIDFGSKIAAIIGQNGSGKTNILESISLLSTLRSPRGSLAEQMINAGEDSMFIEAETKNKHGDHIIRLMSKRSGEKKVSVDGHVLRKATELLGVFQSVFFSLGDINLASGAPQGRRRFFDLVLVQASHSYKFNLQNYSMALKQRNVLLKGIKMQQAKEGELDIWDESLSQFGSKVINERLEFLEDMKWFIEDMYDKLSNKKEELKIGYITTVYSEKARNYYSQTSELKRVNQEDFLRKLKRERPRELEIGTTLVGPHRDDLVLIVDNFKVNGYASMGQERSIVISLKMAQAEYLGKKGGDPPVILLDDCFLELDQSRKKRIWQELNEKAQVILVMTEMDKSLEGMDNLITFELARAMQEKHV